jgi:hypothetical protein
LRQYLLAKWKDVQNKSQKSKASSGNGRLREETIHATLSHHPTNYARPTSSMRRHHNTTATPLPQKESDDVLLVGGRLHDANAAAASTSRTKYLLSALTTLALVVPYYKEILSGLGRADALTKTAYIHHRLPDPAVDAGPNPKRIVPFDPSDKFSFVHISKCAGSTWIRLLNEVLKLNTCPEKETGPEFSVSYQQQFVWLVGCMARAPSKKWRGILLQ